jgi:hypothetical protein
MLLMIITTWPPENREKQLQYAAEYMKANPLPTPGGLQQVWLDIHGNRWFELVDMPKPRDPKDEVKLYDQFLSHTSVERIEVMEIGEALKALRMD